MKEHTCQTCRMTIVPYRHAGKMVYPTKYCNRVCQDMKRRYPKIFIGRRFITPLGKTLYTKDNITIDLTRP